MAARMIAFLYADNMDWIAEYSANVPQLVARHGGSYNFVATAGVQVLEGDRPVPTGAGIFAFPTPEAARAFLEDPDYAPYIELRNRHSRTEVYVLDGNEVG